MAKRVLRLQALSILTALALMGAACSKGDSSGHGNGDGDGDGDLSTPAGGSTGTGGFGSGGTSTDTGGGTNASACDGSEERVGTDPLIDDLQHLESGSIPDVDGRMGSWFTSNDGTPGTAPSVAQAPPSAMAYPTADAGNEGSGDHAFASAATGYADWGANFGVTLNAVGTYGCALDATGFEGIEFWAKTGDQTDQDVWIGLPIIEVIPTTRGGTCSGVGCDDAHRLMVEITGEWQKFQVPFADLQQNAAWPHDNKYPFDPARLAQITWTGATTPGAYDLVVDDVAFYGQNVGLGGGGNGSM